MISCMCTDLDCCRCGDEVAEDEEEEEEGGERREKELS